MRARHGRGPIGPIRHLSSPISHEYLYLVYVFGIRLVMYFLRSRSNFYNYRVLEEKNKADFKKTAHVRSGSRDRGRVLARPLRLLCLLGQPRRMLGLLLRELRSLALEVLQLRL